MKKFLMVTCVVIWVSMTLALVVKADESTACRFLHSNSEDVLECMDGTETVLASPPRYTKNGCYPGSVEPVSHEDFVFLRGLKCVAGDVDIEGIMMDGNDVLTTLDFGELEWIRGTLFVRLMPRLNTIIWTEGLITYRVIVENNGMLPQSRATEFVESVCEDGRRTEQLNAP